MSTVDSRILYYKLRYPTIGTTDYLTNIATVSHYLNEENMSCIEYEYHGTLHFIFRQYQIYPCRYVNVGICNLIIDNQQLFEGDIKDIILFVKNNNLTTIQDSANITAS